MNNDQLLLDKISTGDELAFRVLFNKHRKQVYTYALKIIKSDVVAEEILHDVFLKIWLHENLTSIENLGAFLKTLTRNLTLNTLRRQNLEISFNTIKAINWNESHNETEETILLNDSEKLLNNAIDLLTPQQKLVYKLCKQEGLKYAQAAEKLSISPLTVKTHMQHVLRFLRDYLEKHNGLAVCVMLLKLFYKER